MPMRVRLRPFQDEHRSVDTLRETKSRYSIGGLGKRRAWGRRGERDGGPGRAKTSWIVIRAIIFRDDLSVHSIIEMGAVVELTLFQTVLTEMSPKTPDASMQQFTMCEEEDAGILDANRAEMYRKESVIDRTTAKCTQKIHGFRDAAQKRAGTMLGSLDGCSRQRHKGCG